MKKKLGLLMSIIHMPKLLVLDEPTNGLDVESVHLFYDIIFRLARTGVTILFSTHLMDHVEKLCSHVVVINQGAVVSQGPLAELQTKFDQGESGGYFPSIDRQAAAVTSARASHPGFWRILSCCWALRGGAPSAAASARLSCSAAAPPRAGGGPGSGSFSILSSARS